MGTGARYLQILAVQRPFPFATDEHARTMFSSNYEALATSPAWLASGSVSFEDDIKAILIGAGVATSGSTFIGPHAVLPADAGPYVSIIDTGGSAPLDTHDGAKYERLSFQVVVRGSFATARSRALAIWSALDGLRNVTVA